MKANIKNIKEELATLKKSCEEGKSGEWDTTTEEGAEGFDAMRNSIEDVEIAIHAIEQTIEEAREVILHFMDAPDFNGEHAHIYEKLKRILNQK